MIRHSPLQVACRDCGAPFAGPCDASCPSAISNRIDSALADEDSATGDSPCCTDPWCPCRAGLPAAPVLDLQRRCDGCHDLVAVHTAIRCGTHTHCALCALSSLCFDCKALLMEELRERAEDAAYDTDRQEHSR